MSRGFGPNFFTIMKENKQTKSVAEKTNPGLWGKTVNFLKGTPDNSRAEAAEARVVELEECLAGKETELEFSQESIGSMITRAQIAESGLIRLRRAVNGRGIQKDTPDLLDQLADYLESSGFSEDEALTPDLVRERAQAIREVM